MMNYHSTTILTTDASAAGDEIPVAHLKRILIGLYGAESASVRIEARQQGGSWRRLALLEGEAELNIENFGWYSLRAVASNEAAETLSVVLSGR